MAVCSHQTPGHVRSCTHSYCTARVQIKQRVARYCRFECSGRLESIEAVETSGFFLWAALAAAVRLFLLERTGRPPGMGSRSSRVAPARKRSRGRQAAGAGARVLLK